MGGLLGGGPTASPGTITRLLRRCGAGDESAQEALYALVYNELRWIARARVRETNGAGRLQPTEVVNEAYLRLQEVDRRLTWQDRREAAEPLLKRSLEVKRRALGPDHPSVAFTLDALGHYYLSRAELVRAGSLLERAIAIREEKLGPSHPYLAHSLANLGMVLIEAGAAEKAKAPLLRALEILESQPGPDEITAEVLILAARLRAAGGETDKARELYDRAREILNELLREEPSASAEAGLAAAYLGL